MAGPLTTQTSLLLRVFNNKTLLGVTAVVLALDTAQIGGAGPRWDKMLYTPWHSWFPQLSWPTWVTRHMSCLSAPLRWWLGHTHATLGWQLSEL